MSVALAEVAAPPAAPVRGPARSPWIVSARDDLLWLHGSVLVGVALLAYFARFPAGPATLVALLAWGVLFDGTHVMGTYARSYLAPDPESRAALPGSWSWLLLALGPAVALIDHALCVPGPSLVGQAGLIFRWFLLGAYLWAYFHLVRQHYGFLVLYARRSASGGTRPETAILWAGCLYPYLRFSLGDGYLGSGLPQLVPPAAAPLLPLLRAGLDVVAGAIGAGAVVLALRHRARLGPQHLLLVVVVAFHVAVFALLNDLLAITATLTIFHNLQYHRIVWQYERGKGRVPAGSLGRYLGLGIALGAAWYGPRVLGVALAPSDLVRNLLLGLGWGVAFHHYLVDGRIWRVRRAPAVARTLDAGAR